ncbi:MAG TPA: hypothetical protein VKP04_04745 [Ktedonobacteraceae bacterium]|nr:hypothetical protein [Ktedonobacteraceae bacterium]
MYTFLASDPLAALGQIGAIILLLYLLVFILIGLAIALILLFSMTLMREKIEIIKRIRPVVNSVNSTAQAASSDTLPQRREDENRIVRAVAEIPAYTRTIETKVEQGSNRVASAVIEFRARTMMAKGVAKALFLPGLTNRSQRQFELEGGGFRSPGYRILIEEKTSENGSIAPGRGYEGSVTASQLKGEPIAEVTESPGPSNAPTH